MESNRIGMKRLDAVLVERGLVPSRERAKEAVCSGRVKVNGRTAGKPALMVGPEDAISCEGEGPRYVGRGGEKLQKVLEESRLSVHGLCVLDVGASTGGFTDCLLQHGAAEVFALDVGRGQLHPSLRADPRVHCLEETDIRDTVKVQTFLGGRLLSYCTIDVAFISLKQVLPAVLPLLSPEAVIVCLIKPQFEAGRAALGNNGVVRHKADHIRVLQEQLHLFGACGCDVVYLSYSPVTGGTGNREYLAALRRGGKERWKPDVKQLVDNAFRTLKA
ncbi:MAG: TlyA family RNA methyltransferase [Clostridiales bacterium]|nr:TlyA family RNA methyltransferase [Clostridiales bacterium]